MNVALAAEVASTHPVSEGEKRVVASPYAKKLTKELKVNWGGQVVGPMARIMAKDVEAVVAGMAPMDSLVAAAMPGIELGKMVSFTTMQVVVSRNMAKICWKAVFNESHMYG